MKLLILCGGQSEEHEISLISATHILAALDRNRFEPIVVGISREGTWHLENEKTFTLGGKRADQIRLNVDAPRVSILPSDSTKGKLEASGETVEFDVVFPILHGPHGEDGTMQGLLDLLHVPYVGANCGSSWICMDKALTKIIAKHADIPTADFVPISSLSELEKQRSNIEKLGTPVFVKPNRLGSSVAVSKVKKVSDLRPAVELALNHDRTCLIEQFLDGREIECAVLGLNGSPRASKPGEIIPSKKVEFYSYEAKYLLSDGAELLIPAPLDSSSTLRVQEFSIRVFQALQCDGMARIDLFLDRVSGRLFLNEANTIPGFTPISMYPKLWGISGVNYPDLITELIRLAFTRLGKVF